MILLILAVFDLFLWLWLAADWFLGMRRVTRLRRAEVSWPRCFPSLSVVIPVRNEAKALEASLRSEGELTLKGLFAAREVFITSTLKAVLPVVAVDKHVIGDGQPGPVTRRLATLLEGCVERYLSAPPLAHDRNEKQ